MEHADTYEDSEHGAAADTQSATEEAQHQHHPLKVYFIVWGWLFVLSAASYFVDYIGLQGYLRWTLILIFMVLKAGLIMAIFMHMRWERMALNYVVLIPPVAVLAFVAIMAIESDYTFITRMTYFGTN